MPKPKSCYTAKDQMTAREPHNRSGSHGFDKREHMNGRRQGGRSKRASQLERDDGPKSAYRFHHDLEEPCRRVQIRLTQLGSLCCALSGDVRDAQYDAETELATGLEVEHG